MELKNDSIREAIKKEGIGSTEEKFGTDVVTNELKKDFELIKEIIGGQPTSAFEYCIFRLVPLEASILYEKQILEFQTDRVMQENPTANREEVLATLKKYFDRSIVRQEYTEKSIVYNDLYLGIEFANNKYGEDNIQAILNADPRLKQNLIDFGRIKEDEQTVEQTADEDKIPVEEEQKVVETPIKEDFAGEEGKDLAVESKVEEKPKKEEVTTEETPTEEIPEKKSRRIDPKKLSPKAINLIKKVKVLCEKCSNENNIVKKHLLKFKLRMLTVRLQEELDLYYLKEEYRIKAEELKAKTVSKQKNDILAIININKQIKQRENVLRSYSEYDYYSPDFMFPKSLVEQCGGIKEFAKQLEEDKNPTIQIAGKNISGSLRYREQIQDLKKQISDRQKEMELREKEAFEESTKLNYMEQENQIALKEPNIIFKRIKEFFKIARVSIQDFRNELSERRELAKEYKQKEAELREQFDLQMRQFKEDAKKAKNSSITKRDISFMERMKENVTEEPSYENVEHEIHEKQSDAEER